VAQGEGKRRQLRKSYTEENGERALHIRQAETITATI
jgi:hypothetical protein